MADASWRWRIASATFGSREFSDSRAVAWAICWLVMPPWASWAAVNISASRAWRWSFCRSAAAAYTSRQDAISTGVVPALSAVSDATALWQTGSADSPLPALASWRARSR